MRVQKVASPDALLVLMILMYWTGFSMLRPLIGPYVSSVGGTAGEIAVIIGAQAALPFLMAVPLGGVADGHDPRLTGVGGAVLLVVGSGSLAASTSTLALVLSQTLVGLGGLAVWLSVQVLITAQRHDQVGEPVVGVRRARRIANFTVLIGAGQLIGPVLAGVLADQLSYRWTFVVIAAVFFAVVFAAYLYPSSRRPRSSAPRLANAHLLLQSFPRAWHLVMNRGGFRAALGATFVALYLVELRTTLLPVYLAAEAVSLTTVGALLSGAAGAGMVSRLLLPMLLARLGPGPTTALCLVPGAVLLAATSLTTATWILALLILTHGLSVGLAQPMTLSFVAEATRETERGVGLSVRLSGTRLAQWTGPLVFGILAAGLPLAGAFGVATAVAVPLGVVTSRSVSRSPELHDTGAGVPHQP